MTIDNIIIYIKGLFKMGIITLFPAILFLGIYLILEGLYTVAK